MAVEAPPSVQPRSGSRSPVRVLWGDLDADDTGASDDVRLPSDAAQGASSCLLLALSVVTGYSIKAAVPVRLSKIAALGIRARARRSTRMTARTTGTLCVHGALISAGSIARSMRTGTPALLLHARLQLQQAEVHWQLRIEDRRFDVAQAQLQVQVEKTATARAQLAAEEAPAAVLSASWTWTSIDKQQAAAASLKADRESAAGLRQDP